MIDHDICERARCKELQSISNGDFLVCGVIMDATFGSVTCPPYETIGVPSGCPYIVEHTILRKGNNAVKEGV